MHLLTIAEIKVFHEAEQLFGYGLNAPKGAAKSFQLVLQVFLNPQCKRLFPFVFVHSFKLLSFHITLFSQCTQIIVSCAKYTPYKESVTFEHFAHPLGLNLWHWCSAQCSCCQLECSGSQNLSCSFYRRIKCSCRYYLEHPKILL